MSEYNPLEDREFNTPGTSRGLIDVFHYKYLLTLLIKKGTATRYHGSILGWVWSYIRPAAQFLMFYIVIGVILNAREEVPLFPVYLFSGIVAVNLFSEALRNATNAIVDNTALVQKIYLPRELFPISALGVALIHFLPQAAILLLVALVLGWHITLAGVASFFVGMLIILIFSLGLGLFFGAINVAFRDASNVVDLILMFATWASPVLYTWSMVYQRADQWLYELYMLNPMTIGVELFHDAFWLPIVEGLPGSARPEQLLMNTGWSLLIALATLFIGQTVFRKMEGSFAQNL